MACHPGLGDAPQPLRHQGRGAQAAHQQLLQRVCRVHGDCGRNARRRPVDLPEPWRFLWSVAMADNRPIWRIAAPLAAPLGGLLAGLALPPLGWPPLLWLALLPLWALGPRAALVWGGAAVLISHRWLLWLHTLDWVGVPLPLSLPLCVGLLLAIALLGALLVGSWRWLVPSCVSVTASAPLPLSQPSLLYLLLCVTALPRV